MLLTEFGGNLERHFSDASFTDYHCQHYRFRLLFQTKFLFNGIAFKDLYNFPILYPVFSLTVLQEVYLYS